MPLSLNANANAAPLSALDASQYASDSYTYPLNLDAAGAGLGHFVLFHINQNNLTQFGTANVGGSSPTDTPTISFDAGIGQQGGVNADAANGAIATNVAQAISRVSTTIALYMPNQMGVEYNTDWTKTDLGVARTIFAGSIADAVADGTVSVLKKALQSSSELEGIAAAAGNALRIASNNHTELLFENVSYREFDFEFMFVPQSPSEALNIQNIIKAFKFYAMPEIIAGTVGRFWLYPSEFDISYISNGVENPWFNKISTCALTSIGVNYTPSGVWSALRKTGVMTPGVATKLTLHFKELELMQKQRILDNF
jgi:hypothetical protein